MADTEQTLADLIEPLRVSAQLGSDTEADTTAGPWMKFWAPSAPVLSDEEVPGALFRPSDAGDRLIVER
jgi:hypothetical protein